MRISGSSSWRKAMRLARLYFGCDAWPQVRLDER